MIGENKPAPEQEEPNELQIIQLEAPAVFCNYFFVWSDGGMVRATFVESGAGGVVIPRSAVCFSMDNAKYLYDVLGKTIEATEAAQQGKRTIHPVNDRPM